MALPAKTKIFKQLSTVLLARDTASGASTTIDTASAKGQKVVSVTATTSFTVGDTVRVGAGEWLELGTIDTITAGESLTLDDNLTYDHAVGEAVVEQTAYDLGAVTDGGVTVTATGATTDVQSAMQRLVYTVLNGYVDLSAEFDLPGLTVHNFAVATGTPLANISGSGTTAAPYSLVTDGSGFGGEVNDSLICIGEAVDGTDLRVELWGVDFDYTGLSINLQRGTLSPVHVKAVASAGGMASTAASNYTADTTVKPTSGKVFAGIDEIGLFSDNSSGGDSTLASAATAGATSITVATGDGADYTDEEWISIGADDTIEYHQIESISTDTLTLHSKLLRAQASGVAVKSQTQTALAGVAESGPTIAVGGNVDPVRFAERRVSAGLKPGAATITITVPLTNIADLKTIARALGIPQADVANSRVALSEAIGTDTIDGIYLKGVLQDGSVIYINGWSNGPDVSNAVLTMAQTGVPSMNVTVKPQSGLQLQEG